MYGSKVKGQKKIYFVNIERTWNALLTKGKANADRNGNVTWLQRDNAAQMSQLLSTVLGAIHPCTEPHNTHKTAPNSFLPTLRYWDGTQNLWHIRQLLYH